MRLATWNVNSIKVRLEAVLGWLAAHEPDALLLQEIKCTAEAFPAAALKAAGWQAVVVGQKTYNGVAVLTRRPVEVLETALPGAAPEEPARWCAVRLDGLTIGCLYLPNGNPPDNADKFGFKLSWMERLAARAADWQAAETPFVLGGDFNVIPEPEDCWDPRAWEGDALFRPEVRRAFRSLKNRGLVDALRAVTDQPRQYTFWDYQAGRWPRDEGIRIDHWLLSPQATDRLVDCRIDRAPRGAAKASDHTPVVLELAD